MTCIGDKNGEMMRVRNSQFITTVCSEADTVASLVRPFQVEVVVEW